MKDDLISRKAVLDAIEKYFDGLPIQGHYDMIQIIKKLPSVESDSKAFYEQGRIQGHVKMRTELLMQLREIVGVEVWMNL